MNWLASALNKKTTWKSVPASAT